MSYPTQAQMQRVEAAARELEEAMRACKYALFEVHYGNIYRRWGENGFISVNNAITVVVKSKLPLFE